MKHSTATASMPWSIPTSNQERRYAAIRTALIGYGIAAFSYLFARHGFSNETNALGMGGSVSAFMLFGLGLQVLLIVARIVIKRVAADRNIAPQVLLMLELIGDGTTVLLFALATLGVIVHAPDDL